MTVPVERIQRLAGLELNLLRAADVLGKEFEGVRVPRIGTPVYDVNGALLFYRLPLKRGRTFSGYADIAADEVLAEPLLAVAAGVTWNEKAILEEASAVAHERHSSIKFNSIRLVAYSFPKLAVQYLLGDREVLMLEWKTWSEVPQRSPERRPLEPSNFERWSLIDEMPVEVKRARVQSFKERQTVWETPDLREIDPSVITRETFDLSRIVIRLSDTREVHYSPRSDDHHPCYELRGQQTGVWCVAASVEMLMNYYRYQYDQPRLAREMGLGTCNNPNGLPYGLEYKVVDTIEKLSSNTLDATAIVDPTWDTFQTEIRADRPLISFIPGHSRTVAGYTRNLFMLPGQMPFKGLLVYDPWPPTDCAHPENGGTITKWENFATQIYRYAFTAVLEHV